MTAARDVHRNNVLIGSGEVFLDLLDEEGATTGERYAGDTAGAVLSVTTERLTVFGGDGPVAALLADRARSQTRTLALVLRDISLDNLALFVGAPEPQSLAAVSAAVTGEALTVQPGRWYALGVSDDRPSGVGAVSGKPGEFSVTDAAGATVYTAGSDYDLDAAHGRLHIAAAGAVGADTRVLVSYKPAAPQRRQARAGAPRTARCAVRYIEDSDLGAERHYYAPLCIISAGDELALKSRDSEQQIHLVCEILEPGGSKAALLIDGAPA